MELLGTIVNELTNVGVSLTSPLLKTKVLATRLQNQDILEWVNNELNGYPDIKVVPKYRKTKGEIAASYINGNWHATNQVLNLPEFDEVTTENLYTMHFVQSVQALESYQSDGSNYIAEMLSGGQRTVMERYLEASNPYFQLSKIYRRVPCNFVLEILSHIRNRLLEFMLQIESEYGTLSKIHELQPHNKEITKIMKTTIINSGDGAIINSGNENSIQAKVTVKKGDKDYLQRELMREKVTQEDINELLNVVDNEPPTSKGNFGNGVNDWMKKMLGKAVDGSWQVSIGAAGNILAEALQRYYGLQ